MYILRSQSKVPIYIYIYIYIYITTYFNIVYAYTCSNVLGFTTRLASLKGPQPTFVVNFGSMPSRRKGPIPDILKGLGLGFRGLGLRV